MPRTEIVEKESIGARLVYAPFWVRIVLVILWILAVVGVTIAINKVTSAIMVFAFLPVILAFVFPTMPRNDERTESVAYSDVLYSLEARTRESEIRIRLIEKGMPDSEADDLISRVSAKYYGGKVREYFGKLVGALIVTGMAAAIYLQLGHPFAAGFMVFSGVAALAYLLIGISYKMKIGI